MTSSYEAYVTSIRVELSGSSCPGFTKFVSAMYLVERLEGEFDFEMDVKCLRLLYSFIFLIYLIS